MLLRSLPYKVFKFAIRLERTVSMTQTNAFLLGVRNNAYIARTPVVALLEYKYMFLRELCQKKIFIYFMLHTKKIVHTFVKYL